MEGVFVLRSSLCLRRRQGPSLDDRYHVTYDDITALVLPVLRHRILLNFHAESERIDTDEILHRLLRRICRRRRRCKVQRFLDPSVLAGISGLDLIAKTVVDGFVAGTPPLAGLWLQSGVRGVSRICAG